MRSTNLLVATWLLGAIATCAAPTEAGAAPLLENYVTFESKSVVAGAADQSMGVYIGNAVDLAVMVLPFELRTVSGGAYIDGPFTVTISGRVAASGLEDFPSKLYANTPSGANTCSGPISQTWTGAGASPNADGSPDGYMYSGLVTTSPPLAPGTDPPGDPSFIITFDANGNTGAFEIDTACYAPSGHLAFVDPDIHSVSPLAVNKGTITIEPTDTSYVIFESKSIVVGATNQSVGIYIGNTVELSTLYLPFELRTVSGGAYIEGPFTVMISGRVAASGLQDFATKLYYNTPGVNTCSGPTSQTWTGGGGTPNANGFSDAYSYNGLVTTGQYFAPGTDPQGDPSLIIMFDANLNPGVFEIDTACTAPADHIAFVDPAIQPVPFTVTMGTVTLTPCPCDCQGDRLCDGEYNVLDVIMVVAVAFREAPEVPDPNPSCPTTVTDLDCNGVTNVFDLVRLANVAFRNADPQVEFCNPCAP